MSQKRLTVFTPAYNREKLLKRLYDSLVNQTCKDFVWLIVDDGSTDNTYGVAQSLAAKDSRIILLQNQYFPMLKV